MSIGRIRCIGSTGLLWIAMETRGTNLRERQIRRRIRLLDRPACATGENEQRAFFLSTSRLLTPQSSLQYHSILTLFRDAVNSYRSPNPVVEAFLSGWPKVAEVSPSSMLVLLSRVNT